ncbi:hypothetical protein LJC10_00685 [Selenomonadales bacterium OttesenSCG-928-I06]|nr:hypothetical protein [Selenomonadales bacterium OttesenSCG-928-I06]
MKTYYKGWYGATASITKTKCGEYRLKVRGVTGKLFVNKVYETYKGVMIALGKNLEGWKEVA